MNLLDIALILVMIFIACIGAAHGFFKSLAGVTAYIVSAFVSKIASLPVAEAVYDGGLREKVLSVLNNALPSGSVQGSIATALETATESLPSYIGSAVQYFTPSLTDDSDAFLTVAEIESSYVSPIVVKVLTWIAAALIFVLCSLLLRIVFNWLNKMLFRKKNPGLLSWVNKILGFLLGGVKGVIVVLAACLLLNLLCPVFGDGGFSEIVSASAVCKFVSQIF